MGNTCCRQDLNPPEIQSNSPEHPNDFKSEKTKSIRVGPDMFVKLKKGDIYSVYSVGKQLGEGAYGSVSLVTHKKSQIKRAMKALKKDSLFEEDEQKLFSEMQILKEIDHPNIDEKFYYLVTEFLQGGELFDRIQELSNFNEQVAANIMRQVMSAVAYCHDKNIVHRDLKPENIIFTNQDMDLKVIDFGTSRKFDDQQMTKRLGTPYYIAPEVLHKSYNQKCDIWSCGVILYILLAGYPPFNGRSESEIFAKILKGKFIFYKEEWENISDDAKDLITNMLQVNVDQRFSAQEVLEHRWVKKNQQVKEIDKKVLENLGKFRAKGQLKQSLMTFMASQMITQKEQEELKNAFQGLDKNGDGTLTKEELMLAFQAELTDKNKMIENMDERIQVIFDKVDINNSGKIDYTEFILAGLEENKFFTQQKIQQTFDILDIDGDQFISKEELEQVMEGLNDDIWIEFLAECDQDNDGKISKQEFIDILMTKV